MDLKNNCLIRHGCWLMEENEKISRSFNLISKVNLLKPGLMIGFFQMPSSRPLKGYFSLNNINLSFSCTRQFIQRQSWYRSSTKALSSMLNCMPLHWQCIISPALHSNALLQRGQVFASCSGIYIFYCFISTTLSGFMPGVTENENFFVPFLSKQKTSPGDV